MITAKEAKELLKNTTPRIIPSLNMKEYFHGTIIPEIERKIIEQVSRGEKVIDYVHCFERPSEANKCGKMLSDFLESNGYDHFYQTDCATFYLNGYEIFVNILCVRIDI